MTKKITSIACDHGGLTLKTALVKALTDKGFVVLDKGTFTKDSVDYPDYAKLVCDDVKNGNAEFGILVCTSGIGMSMAANKVRGIRAALILNEDAAKFSRLHNDANVICLGEKYLSTEKAVELVDIFASTEHEGGRHTRRVQKFMAFENEK